MTAWDIAVSLLIVAFGAVACLVWERAALRAAARRRDRAEVAALEEQLHPGDDCGLLVVDDSDEEDEVITGVFCRCRSCESGVVTIGHCVDRVDGAAWHDCVALATPPVGEERTVSFCSPTYLQRCSCGHVWLHHDVDEYRGDGSEMCCVEGCDQNGCPGRSRVAVPDPAPTLREESIDVPRERLYAAGGFIRLGRNVLHEDCLRFRREGQPGEICAECRPSLVGSATQLPHRTAEP